MPPPKVTPRLTSSKHLRTIREQVLNIWIKNARITTRPLQSKQRISKMKERFARGWKEGEQERMNKKMELEEEQQKKERERKKKGQGEELLEEQESDVNMGPKRTRKPINKMKTAERAKKIYHNMRSSPYRRQSLMNAANSKQKKKETERLDVRIARATEGGEKPSRRFKSVVRRLRRITKSGNKRVVGPFNTAAKRRYELICARFERMKARDEIKLAVHLAEQKEQMHKACSAVEKMYPSQWAKMWTRKPEERIIPIQRRAPLDAPSQQVWCSVYFGDNVALKAAQANNNNQ